MASWSRAVSARWTYPDQQRIHRLITTEGLAKMPACKPESDDLVVTIDERRSEDSPKREWPWLCNRRLRSISADWRMLTILNSPTTNWRPSNHGYQTPSPLSITSTKRPRIFHRLSI